jgi:hypothetical protein
MSIYPSSLGGAIPDAPFWKTGQCPTEQRPKKSQGASKIDWGHFGLIDLVRGLISPLADGVPYFKDPQKSEVIEYKFSDLVVFYIPNRSQSQAVSDSQEEGVPGYLSFFTNLKKAVKLKQFILEDLTMAKIISLGSNDWTAGHLWVVETASQ